MNKILIIIIVLIAALGAFTFLGNKNTSPTVSKQSQPAAAEPSNPIITITLTNSGFTPKDITVKTGTKVVWKNSSGQIATVNSDDHPTHRLYPFLNLGEFANQKYLQVIFDKAGKFGYHDHYNATSTGTVTVE